MLKIKVIKGDITKLKVDAVVNAANETLLGGLGVDGAIHKAAGPELLAECQTLHGCKTGQAKITQGYHLPAKYVIHTVGPIYSGRARDDAFLRACYVNSLDLAKENNLHSIAFPAISTGAYGFPTGRAALIAFQTVKKWLRKNEAAKIEVIMCAFDDKTAALYQKQV
ncbi:O-acetyl-ADP-ribose deacetylase [Lactobacillus sp. ESL0701]|uniref:O-acetyl-ADP-ribose deacetylase n=1 Tax=Lactobacillus sp. ESL0701 TaxID=2983217 RepID=UPI0023F89E52|nr:O-acetyl-ADP-ribose deacetylase [Lactobacillus sp. ESL0701]MDF7671778.1 O-acetyl-ADP-ribose deacetylase [Lactobacillus sp. ESL0701]